MKARTIFTTSDQRRRLELRLWGAEYRVSV